MKFKQIQILIVVVLALGLSACSATHEHVTPDSDLEVRLDQPSKGSIDQAVSSRSDAIHSYLMGRLSYGQENFDEALKHFNRATELADIPESDIYVRLAELSLLSGDVDQAYSQILKAREVGQSDGRVEMLHGGILEALSKDAEAIKHYQLAITQNPNRFDAAISLAALLARAKRYSEAEVVLKRLGKNKDFAFIADYYLGRIGEQRADLVMARKHLEKALAIEPTNPAVLLNLVRVLLKGGKTETALKVAATALKLDPNNRLAQSLAQRLTQSPESLQQEVNNPVVFGSPEEDWLDTKFKIALMLIEQRFFDDAKRELSLILTRDPANAEARYYLASLYAGSGMRKLAVAELLKIGKDDDLYIKSRTFAAFILRQDGELAQAEQVVQEAFEKDPQDRNVLSYLVLILRDAEKYSEAKDLLETALETEPQNDRLLFHYGVVLGDLGQAEEALQAMERVIAANPDHSDALNYLAYALAEEGTDLDRAYSLAQRAIGIRPNDGYYLDTIGWIQFKRGELVQSEESLARAVKLTGEDVVIMEHHGDVLSALGHNERALQVYRSAIEKGRDAASPSQDVRDSLGRLEEKVKRLEPMIQGALTIQN